MNDTKFSKGPFQFVDVPGANLEIRAKVNIGRDAGDGILQPIYNVPIKPILQVGDDGSVYATIAYDDWRQFPSNDFKTMQYANGHLFAAAPELYAMTKDLVRALEVNHAGAAILKEARELLARARGES